jgi:hypothetical protein
MRKILTPGLLTSGLLFIVMSGNIAADCNVAREVKFSLLESVSEPTKVIMSIDGGEEIPVGLLTETSRSKGQNGRLEFSNSFPSISH